MPGLYKFGRIFLPNFQLFKPRGLLDYLESKDSVPSSATISNERDLLTIRNNLELANCAERDRPFAQLQDQLRSKKF